MAITNLDGYIAAAKQNVLICKTASITSVAGQFTQVLQVAGSPGAGVLAGTSTTAGVVPTDATQGFPPIDTFVGTGYLTRVRSMWDKVGALTLADCLFKSGAYPFNANVTLAAQPSYASRVPGGTDFKGLQIWIEAVTAFTGNQTITVTYTNQDGVTAKSTGAIATGVAPGIARMRQLNLAAGDSGVQKIESVVSSGSTAGTFNVLVLRPLWVGLQPVAITGVSHDMLTTGMPQVFDTSALMVIARPTSTATGVIDVMAEIANA